MSGVDGGNVDDHDNGGGDWVDDCDTNANANFEKYVSLGWDGMRQLIELDTKADFPGVLLNKTSMFSSQKS